MLEAHESRRRPLRPRHAARRRGAAIGAPRTATVGPMASSLAPTGALTPASDSDAWLGALRADGAVGDRAVESLHELLLRGARFEVSRRRTSLAHVRGEELDDVAMQAANDAL